MDNDIITFLRLNYCLSSETGNIEEERYINKYNIDVYEIQIDENDKESASLIGSKHSANPVFPPLKVLLSFA